MGGARGREASEMAVGETGLIMLPTALLLSVSLPTALLLTALLPTRSP